MSGAAWSRLKSMLPFPGTDHLWLLGLTMNQLPMLLVAYSLVCRSAMFKYMSYCQAYGMHKKPAGVSVAVLEQARQSCCMQQPSPR